MLEIPLLLTEFTKIVRNVQWTTHHAVKPSCKLTGKFKSKHSIITKECSRLTDFWDNIKMETSYDE
jgi:hypothetical protein